MIQENEKGLFSAHYEDVTLENICNGSVPELFKMELRKVLANIADTSTDAVAPREITIKIAFRSNEHRTLISTQASSSHKPAPPKPSKSYIRIATDKGRLKAVQEKRQEQFEFGDSDSVVLGGENEE